MKVLGWYATDSSVFAIPAKDKETAENIAEDYRTFEPGSECRAVLLAEIDESEISKQPMGE